VSDLHLSIPWLLRGSRRASAWWVYLATLRHCAWASNEVVYMMLKDAERKAWEAGRISQSDLLFAAMGLAARHKGK
jgi:hypothetical protein